MLSAEVELHSPDCLGSRTIIVGNTGLFLVEQLRVPDSWCLHFTPEGNTFAVDGKCQQYAVTFLGALSALTEWCHQQENTRPKYLYVNTNPRMAEFIKRKLGSVVSFTHTTDYEISLMIKWEELCNNPSLLSNLDGAYRQLQMNRYWVEGMT